jgi:hypothetical protein
LEGKETPPLGAGDGSARVMEAGLEAPLPVAQLVDLRFFVSQVRFQSQHLVLSILRVVRGRFGIQQVVLHTSAVVCEGPQHACEGVKAGPPGSEAQVELGINLSGPIQLREKNQTRPYCLMRAKEAC